MNALQQAWLSLDELSRALGVAPQWIEERVQAGLIELQGERGAAAAWRFDTVLVRRMRSMRRTELAFDAVPELAALVADLEDEIARLRGRLARFE